MRRFAIAAAATVLLALPPGSIRASSALPTVISGPRPGPAVLYAPLATADQFVNGPGWSAPPLRVSGAYAYDSGEFLYQDYVYDSYGANTSDAPFASPDTVPNAGDSAFGAMTGDVVYPTDAATYGYDAADLLEFRAKPVTGGIAYRITLNTMLAADVAGVAIGIDDDLNEGTGTDAWGYGIGTLGSLGLEHVAVTWGTGGELDGSPSAVTSSADTTRNQIDFTIPLDPGTSTLRHYVVVGLFDATAKIFRQVLDQPTATSPGGAHGSGPPPIFNVGFRVEDQGDEPMGNAPEEFGSRAVGYGHWREHAQAKALDARDISAFSVDVNFDALASETDDASHVPTTGWINRLYSSHLSLTPGEGAKDTRPMLLGAVQPYSVYVPSGYAPGYPAPLHVLMHSLSCSYNQYAVFTPNMLDQLGDQRSSFLLTTEGRGPDGWYHDEAEVDLFEAMADMANQYDIDFDQVSVGGYSMGGYGTYKMASQYPDLFAKAFAIVGPADESIVGGPTGGAVEDADNTLRIADNLLNIPLLMWNGVIDELVPLAGVLQYERRMHDLGYRHELNLFPTHDHFLFSVIDQWGPGQIWLQDVLVDRNPAHVVYRAMPGADDPTLGLVHDHAYWVSDIVVATTKPSGLVDARSLVSGQGLPGLTEIAAPGTDPTPHLRRGISWTSTTEDASNTLVVSLTDVASVTLWIDRAGIDLSDTVHVVVTSSTATTVTLKTAAGTFGTVTLPAPGTASVDLP
jgi:pimeloyl-ACP methyl ester carboxylesterase